MLRVALIGLFSLFLSANAIASWELQNSESSVNFVSIKKTKVGEVSYFQQLSGDISRSGGMKVEIDLASVESLIPIRNERLKMMLFNVGKYAEAEVTAKLDMGKLDSLQVGETYSETIPFKLSLHGVGHELDAEVRVVKLSDNRLLAVSVKPIIISADDYGLAEGVKKLREVAKLTTISTAVPVNFSLIFQRH